MRRDIPGWIDASSSTVSVPWPVLARTRDPGISESSMEARTGPREKDVSASALRLRDRVLHHRVRRVDARRVEEAMESRGRVHLEHVGLRTAEDHVDAANPEPDGLDARTAMSFAWSSSFIAIPFA